MSTPTENGTENQNNNNQPIIKGGRFVGRVSDILPEQIVIPETAEPETTQEEAS